MLLNDKTAVVTGGSSGNGREIAISFARQGADVVVADVRREPRLGGEPTADLIRAETDRDAVFTNCDVRNKSDIRDALDAAEELGGVDVMVNNAGIRGSTNPLVDIDEEDYRDVIEINQDGVFYGSQCAARRMQEQDGGSIINMSSVAGIEGYQGGGPYGISKGAIRILTYGLAAELGEWGIRVNSIHPGVIRTGMTLQDGDTIGTETGQELQRSIPLRRFGDPEDVAGVAVFLASDLSGYVTGESIIVDGGVVNTAAHAPNLDY